MNTGVFLFVCVCTFQWIPLLEDGELKTSSYNLCVSAEKPPPAYSQLKTDVRALSSMVTCAYPTLLYRWHCLT